MAAAVAILDTLRKKPVAEKKKQFSVAFFVANADKPQKQQEHAEKKQKEHASDDVMDERLDERNDKETPSKKPMIQITDKTSLNLVKRDEILARIKAAKGIITEAAPNPLTITAAKVVSIVEEAPIPRLKGKKLQKIKLIPVSTTQAVEKVVLPEPIVPSKDIS